MLAAVFQEPNLPLDIRQVPAPSIEDDEVLVKIVACGVCHTDLHYIDHGVPTFKKPPIILGHEVSGTIVQTGKKAENLEEGDHVLIPAVLSCRTCAFCIEGRSNICSNMKMLGNHIDGGFAEYIKVHKNDAFLLPQEVNLQEASVIADAVSTGYHAVVNRARIIPGQWITVFGCGGVGINVVQCASLFGGFVVAVDLNQKRLELASQLGAMITINPSNEKDFIKKIRQITEGGAQAAFECIGNPSSIQNAHDSLRRGGKLCIVGYSNRATELAVSKIMFLEQQIIGSLGCRQADFPKIIELVRVGKIKISPLVTAKFPLANINEAFINLRNGQGLRQLILP